MGSGIGGKNGNLGLWHLIVGQGSSSSPCWRYGITFY